ncbi:MAG: hypothetical protein AAF467_16790 [Actinomycetota bacterium]
MDLDTQTILAFVAGLAAGLALVAIAIPMVNRQRRARHRNQLVGYEEQVAELRAELADDRETNRRLRHELATNRPGDAEMLRTERDEAHGEVARLRGELDQAAEQMAERDRSLREARMAIHEIRVQLEGERFSERAAADTSVEEASST